ncbi:MAG: hypothetical protein AB8B99_20765 [Phormidesmis sp.]
MKKCAVGAALTLPLLLGSMQPAQSSSPIHVFGDRHAGGPNANVPRINGDSRRILSACIDGWADSTRCSSSANAHIANKFCQDRGYAGHAGFQVRRNARRRHDAYVLNTNISRYVARVATGHPLFFTEIACGRH